MLNFYVSIQHDYAFFIDKLFKKQEIHLRKMRIAKRKSQLQAVVDVR